MKRFNYLFLCLLILLSTNLDAQRNCGAMDYLEIQSQNDLKRAEKLQQIEKHTNSVINNPNKAVNGIITVPVVVHIVYNTNAENISDAQVQSQIDVLNDDFRRLNTDANNTWSQAADSQIEFCMATVDPNGNATNGITRTSSSVSAFGTNDQMKYSSQGGKDAWPAGDYLNMWVCDISGGILGYAQFPGGNDATDGVVMDYQYFGTIGTATSPFDLGRTATHEVGHWLNLRHIWGDGNCNVDDFVTDTPTSDGANYGCASSHSSCGTLDMVQNYMDYSDDACMNLFTAGQKTRMRALFEPGGAKASLLSSGACGNVSPPTASCTDGIQNQGETGVDCGGPCAACPTACTDTEVTISITFDNYPEETSWSLTNANGATVASGGTYPSAPDGSTFTETVCLANGCYDFTINDAYGDGICCSYGSGFYSVSSSSATLASGGSFTSSDATNFCVGSTPPPAETCSDGIQNQGETGVDCGGPCAACPSCNDGIQNQGETDVDCGGPCSACPTCSDGVQNGDETGVDCGGSCSPCDTGGECSYFLLYEEDFESSLGYWNGGGSDCRRSVNDAAYANSGSYCVRLRDNTSTSVMTTDAFDLSAYEELTIDFSYYARSMENNEDFWLQVSTNGGSSYQTVASWARGTDFNNDTRYNESVTITGTFGSNVTIRFRNDASGNSDWVYIDDVVIYGCTNSAREMEELPNILAEAEIEAEQTSVVRTQLAVNEMKLYPVPTSGDLNLDLTIAENQELTLYVTDLTGKVVSTESIYAIEGFGNYTIETDRFAVGTYLLSVIGKDMQLSKKFVVIR